MFVCTYAPEHAAPFKVQKNYYWSWPRQAPNDFTHNTENRKPNRAEMMANTGDICTKMHISAKHLRVKKKGDVRRCQRSVRCGPQVKLRPPPCAHRSVDCAGTLDEPKKQSTGTIHDTNNGPDPARRDAARRGTRGRNQETLPVIHEANSFVGVHHTHVPIETVQRILPQADTLSLLEDASDVECQIAEVRDRPPVPAVGVEVVQEGALAGKLTCHKSGSETQQQDVTSTSPPSADGCHARRRTCLKASNQQKITTKTDGTGCRHDESHPPSWRGVNGTFMVRHQHTRIKPLPYFYPYAVEEPTRFA